MAGILIADADRDLCDLYQQFFSHHGWQVRTSGDGLECLGHLHQDRPQLLILDTHLAWGGPDGLLAVMREDPGLATVPVILTATEDAPEAVSGLVAPPVKRVLWKPFSLTALLELVRCDGEDGWSGNGRDSRFSASPGANS